MENAHGILFFAAGFTIAAAIGALLLLMQQLRAKDRVLEEVSEATSAWTANVMRLVRYPSNDEAREALK